MKAYTTEYFIERAKSVYVDKYDYSNTKYINTEIPILITCLKHGDFTIRPLKFLKGRECPHCKPPANRKTYRLTTVQFIEKAKLIHGDKYDYGKVNYINQKTKVILICPKHGEFEMVPNYHLVDKCGCQKCGKESIKEKTAYTTNSFIIVAKKIHGDKYDYSRVKYTDSNTKVTLICPKHGKFEGLPSHHLSGVGCKKCGYDIISIKSRDSIETFIKKATQTHGNKYIYSAIKYNRVLDKVNIICKEHGVFKQLAAIHIQGAGCPKCAGRNLSIMELIDKFKKIHENKYDYSLVNHTKSKTKIDIICNKHGVFKQIPNSHLNGKGCPYCNESKGEEIIKNYLEKNKILFIRQKRFKECKNILPLPFDFYLIDYNLCIEYDGEQHYSPWNQKDKQKAKLNFINLKKRDQIKTNFCQKNNINLIRIKFDMDVKKTLEERLF